MSTVAARLIELGIELPSAPTPIAAYVPFVRTGDLIFVSGQVPLRDGSLLAAGPVPSVVSVEDAREAARQCGMNALAVLANALDGDLDRISRIVRLGIFVCSDPGFSDQPKIGNGASELMLEVFGDAGRHARAAVGSVGLPMGASVEVEVVAEVRGES